MKTRILSAALAALLTTAGTAALAQDAPPPPGQHGGRGGGGLFLHADTDKDGVVTRAELLAGIDARFAKFDANKDGKLTPDERPGMRRHRGGRGGHGMRAPEGQPPRTAPADANKDGAVTLEEHRAPALKLFAYVDRNNDGKVDKAEREAFRDAASALRGPGGPGKRGHRGHGGHGRHGPPPAGSPEAPKGN